MDTFAALALATDAPTERILSRKLVPKSTSLFTTTMWKMILGQEIYQLGVTFTLYFAGMRIIGQHLGTKEPQLVLDTIVFNTFVWMQIFNEFNNRRLDNHYNIFEDMIQNYRFLGIDCIMVGGQVMIIYVGGTAFGITALDPLQWGICITCAVGCVPWAVILRTIPDGPVEVIVKLVAVRPLRIIVDFIADQVFALLRPLKRVVQTSSHNWRPHKDVVPNETPVADDMEAPRITFTAS